MDRELEVIRGEMEETRTNLTGKLETLESQVRETVSSASETVASTVEGVKETVETVTGTVESVAESLNISKQVERYPWISMGVAVGIGYLAGQLLGSRGSRPHHPHPTPQPTPPAPPRRSKEEEPEEEEEGFLGAATSGLNSLAIGTLMGVVREVAASALPPEWKSELSKSINQMTTNLGGKPLMAVPREEEEATASKPPEGRNSGSRGEQSREPKEKSEGSRPNGRRHVARMT